MSRYVRKYASNEQTVVIIEKISRFLISSGYNKEVYEGEYVYKKGDGWFSAPKYVKISNDGGNIIKLEAWIKWVLLPCVFVGEMDFTQNSFIGAIDKSKLKNIVDGINTIINNDLGGTVSNSNAWSFTYSGTQAEASTQNNLNNNGWAEQWNNANKSNSPVINNVQESSANPWESSFVTQNQSTTIDKNNLTLKVFVEKYAPENIRKDIKNAAITGYICSGLTFVLGIGLSNLIGVILSFVIVGLVLGFHLGKSKICAIVWLSIVALDCLISIATVGRPSGWIMIIAGIWAIKALNNAKKEFDIFNQN